jgi:hypothetical protein
MAGGPAVQINGLKALQADLRALDKTLPRELRKVNLSVAQFIAERAKAVSTGLGGQHAKVADVIKAVAEQRSAAVKITATEAVPYALGAEFGAGHNSARQRKSGTYLGYNALPSWRGNSTDAGYSVYPTVRDSGEDIAAAYEQRLTELLAQVFKD